MNRQERGGAAADGRDAMTGWPDQPVIYEINTAVWLDGLSQAAGGRSPSADVVTLCGDDGGTTASSGLVATWPATPIIRSGTRRYQTESPLDRTEITRLWSTHARI